MSFFKDGIGNKVMINIQCGRAEEAVKATEEFGGCILVGVTAKDFPVLADGVALINEMHKNGVKVSAGLGDGSASQWSRSLELAAQTNCVHLNQVFPAAALSQYYLDSLGKSTITNALIKPTGQPGHVCVSTGPESERLADAVIPADTAGAMLSEMGVKSLKFYPISGTDRLDEVREVARVAGRFGLIMEPTGSITPENVAVIVKTCLDAGAEFVMPHLYGSLKNKETGLLDMTKLRTAYENIQSIF